MKKVQIKKTYAELESEIKNYEKILLKVRSDTKMNKLKDIASAFDSYKDKNEVLYDEVNKL